MTGRKTSSSDNQTRQGMLDRIRAGLGVSGQDATRKAAVAARLGASTRHLIPARATASAAGLETLFRTFLEGQSATVLDAATLDDVPAAIAQYLRMSNLPQRVRLGDDQVLAQLDWSKEPALERKPGPATADDEVGLSRATAAVAETGTLVLTSGAANPVTLAFLPETHIIVVSARDIVGPYEDAFARVRALYGRGAMPRTVNFVSGPSRTGDIGGRLVMGAHGPRRLCVIIVQRCAVNGPHHHHPRYHHGDAS